MIEKRCRRILTLLLIVVLCLGLTVHAEPAPLSMETESRNPENEAEDADDLTGPEEDPAETPAGESPELPDEEAVPDEPAAVPAEEENTDPAAEENPAPEEKPLLPEEEKEKESGPEAVLPETEPFSGEILSEEADTDETVREAQTQTDTEPVPMQEVSSEEEAKEVKAAAATALVQASKWSQGGPYAGGATTLSTGPANPRTATTYILDLDEEAYPLAVSWEHYGDYMQGLGILYPGDKLKILPQTDPNPGGSGNHRLPGKILCDSTGWLNLQTGDRTGPLLVSEAIQLGVLEPYYYVREITVEGGPVIFNYSGSGNGGTSSYAVEYEADYSLEPPREASYWPGGTMVYIQLPAYHPVEYQILNQTPYSYYAEIPAEDLSGQAMTVYGENPQVIWAEDLSCAYNPIDGWQNVGPVFTIHHPEIPGYLFEDVSMESTGNEGRFDASKVEGSETSLSSEWRFFYQGALDFNWSFDNKKHGSEEDEIICRFNYKEAKTVTLDASGGTVDDRPSALYVLQYRSSRGTNNWYNYYYDDAYRFKLGEHVPQKAGYVFSGWYADPECTVLVALPTLSVSEMTSALNKYINENNLLEKDGSENCAENITLYAGWSDESAQDISGAAISGLADKPYTGEAVTQNLTVKLNGTTLRAGTDYNLLYSNNINAGTATVHVRGIGSCRGFVSASFSITRKPVTAVITLSQDSFVYDGEPHLPEYTISTVEGIELIEGTDYSLWTSRGIYASQRAGYVMIRLKGNYCGSNGNDSVTQYFAILPKALADDEFTAVLQTTKYTYDGTEKKPRATVTGSEEDLDFTIAYSNNVNAGTATATITLTGDYSGTKSLPFTIKAATKTLSVTVDMDSYNHIFWDIGRYKCPTIEVKYNGTLLEEGKDYEAIYQNNDVAGNATVIASGISAYAGYKGTATFPIEPLDISDSVFTEIEDQEYTGSAIEPTVRMQLPGDYYWTYPNNSYYENDFTVRFKNNILPGTATVTVTGKGNYTGSCSITFKITGSAEIVPVTKVKVSPGTADVATTKTLQLTATVTPSNATDQTITWSSSDKNIATVDSNGLVKAKKYGKVTITAKSSNGKSGKCTVQTRFNDVNNSGKSYYEPVYWAVNKGITVCTVTFRPEDPVKRGEFVAFLWRLAGKPSSSATLDFKDVDTNTKFYDAIRWAVGKGIIKGYGDKTFRADNNVTRGETAVMIWRYAGKPQPKSAVSPFSDIKPSSSDSYKAILWGAEKEIIKGSGGKFNKDDGCTRGQVVTFLYRYTHNK